MARNLVISAHFKVGPLQTRPIQTISLIEVVGLNKVSRILFDFYATFLLIKCCKETPRNSVTSYFYVYMNINELSKSTKLKY